MRNGHWIFVVAAASLTACNFDPTKTCASSDECGAGAFCDDATNTCVEREVCDPVCASHFQCLQGACSARYTGLEIVKPLDGGKAGIVTTIQARPILAPGHEAANLPPTLPFEVEPTAGGAKQSGTLTLKAGEVLYEGTWEPSDETNYKLVVRYPDAGLEASVTVDGDLSAPVLSVIIPTRTLEAPYADPASEWTNAYKRHEQPKLYVSSTAVDIDPATVRFEVRGTNGSSFSDVGIATGAAVPVASDLCAGAAFCAEFTPDLAAPEMRALRADFQVRVTGADDAENQAQAVTDTLPVTRVRWAYDAGTTIKSTPAIGEQGMIYFGTAPTGVSGRLIAVRPDGTVAWEVPGEGALLGSVAVARGPNGAEFVFGVFADGSGTQLIAVNTADRSVIRRCGETATSTVGPVAIIETTTTSAEQSGVATLTNEDTGVSHLETLRPTASECAPKLNATTSVAHDGTLVSDGERIYVGTSTGHARAFSFDGSSWNADWTTPPQPSTSAVQGLAVVDQSLLAATHAGVAQLLLPSGSSIARFDGSTSSAGRFPVVGSGETLFFGTQSGMLAAAPIGDPNSITFMPSGLLAGTPVIGEGGFIYAGSTDGKLRVWSRAPFALMWDGDIATTTTALTIDCAREPSGNKAPGRPGNLYFGANDGALYSIAVDSRGIDTTAAWPKFQHDPRNTGNSTTSLTEFACP